MRTAALLLAYSALNLSTRPMTSRGFVLGGSRRSISSVDFEGILFPPGLPVAFTSDPVIASNLDGESFSRRASRRDFQNSKASSRLFFESHGEDEWPPLV